MPLTSPAQNLPSTVAWGPACSYRSLLSLRCGVCRHLHRSSACGDTFAMQQVEAREDDDGGAGQCPLVGHLAEHEIARGRMREQADIKEGRDGRGRGVTM